jgi:hypothetical protein
MRIKELLKYLILPLGVVYFYFMIWYTDSVKYYSMEQAIVQILLVVFIFLIVLVLILLFVFAFFKDKKIPLIWISSAVFLNTLLTLILENSKKTFWTTVYDYSPGVTSILLFILAIGYFVFALRTISRVKGNGLLFFILILSCLIFTFDFIYFGLIVIDAKFGKGILMFLGIGLFLLLSFIVFFSLPSSDYVEWKIEHKNLFIKAIIIPWSLILYLSFANFIVNPVGDKQQEPKSKKAAFGMDKYEIKQKEGL